jgi:hypothetical protein
MINTNLLLSIGFSIVSNFANVVHVPPGLVPRAPEDVSKAIFGNPSSAAYLFVVHKRGSRFRVNEGVVQSFVSPASFFEHPELAHEGMGRSKLDANQVVALTQSTLECLSKRGRPLTGYLPRLEYAGTFHGDPVPFFRVSWISTNSRPMCAARAEVDGRDGSIVALDLWHPDFLDPGLARQIGERVFVPAKTKRVSDRAPTSKVLRSPSAEEALKDIQQWQRFCYWLDLDTGATSTLADVDWGSSIMYTGSWMSTTIPVCRVAFTNGVLFECINHAVLSHFGPDAFFVHDFLRRPRADWERITGVVSFKWEDLALEFQNRLITNAGIPPELLRSAVRVLRHAGAEPGKRGFTRAVVEWRQGRRITQPTDAQTLPLLLAAEFDLVSGKTTWVSLYDRRLVDRQNSLR